MNHPLHLLIAIAATAALVACGDKAPPPSATDVSPSASSTAPPPAASTPPAIPAQPPTEMNPAETARDSAATNPQGTMSKEQESKSMPMAGQGGSHSSTALDSKDAPKK
jgi:hypothetical protein